MRVMGVIRGSQVIHGYSNDGEVTERPGATGLSAGVEA